MASRRLLVILGSCLAAIGLALGAWSQRESYLAPTPELLQQYDGGASGNLVLLTAFAVAAGAAMTTWGLAYERRGIRTILAAGGALLLTVLIQSAYPDVKILQLNGIEQANVILQPFISAAHGLATVFVLPAALLWAALWAVDQALGPRAQGVDGLTRRAFGLFAIQVPFMLVVAGGALRLLFALPEHVRFGTYRALLPLLAAVAIALAVISVIKLRWLVVATRNGHLASAAEEAWLALGRVEAILAAGFVVLCLSAFVLPTTRLDILQTRSLGYDLRYHTALLPFALVPLVPWFLLPRRVLPVLRGLAVPGTLHGATPRVVWAAVAATAGAAIGVVVGLLTGSALWPWVFAFGPMALWVSVAAGGRRSLQAILMLAAFAWCGGNTLAATFDGHATGLVLYQSGRAALLRMLGVLLAFLAISRALTGMSRLPARRAVPLATFIGVALGVTALLELPFAIWSESSIEGEALALGSLAQAQEGPVAAAMHILAVALVCGAALALAALQRDPTAAQAPRGPPPALKAKTGLPAA